MACQRAKITRHTKAPLASLEMPDRRFTALHLDLVGPLPEAERCCYLLTIIDRYTRWLEALPLPDMTAATCAKALIRNWISRFGVPESIVTDCGRQFTSGIWAQLSNSLGFIQKKTTSYHPQANGMIERQHRTLKDRLISRVCAAGTGTWMEHLPFVLLGLRLSIREDSTCSPSDLLYGTSLRLPGAMLSPPSRDASDVPAPSDFAVHLRAIMKASSPMPVVFHGVPASLVDPALSTAAHVFLRVDAVRRPLVPSIRGALSGGLQDGQDFCHSAEREADYSDN